MIVHRPLVVAGIACAASGIILLTGGILSQIRLEQCRALDQSILSGAAGGANAASCFEKPVPYFAISILLAGAGAAILIMGLNRKQAPAADA